MTSPDDRSDARASVTAPVRPSGGAATYRTIVEAILSAAVLPVSVAMAFVLALHVGTIVALLVALPPALWFVLWIVRTKRRAAFYGLLGLCCAVVATAVVGTGASLWWRASAKNSPRLMMVKPNTASRNMIVRAGSAPLPLAPPTTPEVHRPPDAPTPR